MQKEAKNKIQDLIRKYEAVKASGKIAKYSEEETKKDFVIPLFEALGWDVYDRNEVTAEEQISGNRVDYGFYLNGRIKFYLETKKLSVDLHREDYAEQAIRYSWNKGVTWAVLTDFESLIIFNALSPEKSLAGKKYLSFTYEEYLTRFDELWRLSKESFGNDVLDKEAERVGKKLQKVSVTETLSKDLNECREILTKSFLQWNEKVDPHLIDEGVQKLLNRLIFIRCAEDRKIEPPTLIPLIHKWKSSGKAGEISPYQAMIKKFRELDDIYDSNLFDEHPFEKWDEFGGATEKVIDILYGKKNYFEYDFSIIPADVLGDVYENYLGHQLKKSKKEEHLDKNLKKRKEQGIYYTPKFIVDYIVQNALGPVLDKCRSINDLQKIKILDPACGSGSFLVAAMNFLIKKYEEFNIKSGGLLKIQILKNNIYGVDLDRQAVELARLNLLLNTFDSQIKLPGLENNIKNGNSLISGTDEELKKYFGKNYCDKKPFNWQEEFPEVFKQGGFDCIIGNPPYVNAIQLDVVAGEDVKRFWRDKFISAKGTYDIYILFFEQSLGICRSEGRVAFITPNKYLSSPYGESLRKFITENYKIVKILDLSKIKVFDAPSVYPVITIIDSSKPEKEYNFIAERIFSENLNNKTEYKINSRILRIMPDFNWGLMLSENIKIIEKVLKNSSPLAGIAEVNATSTAAEADEFSNYINEEKNGICIINTGTIDRYSTTYGAANFKNKGRQLKEPFLDISKVNEKRKKLYSSPKIIIAKLALRIEGFIDSGKFASINTNCVHSPKKGYSLEYITAVLNSKLMSFVYSEIFSGLKMSGGYFQFQAPQLRILPIAEAAIASQKKNSILVQKMIVLNKQLNLASENSDKWHKIKDEIAKTDKKIDGEVYKLYGLTEEEIKIVEGN